MFARLTFWILRVFGLVWYVIFFGMVLPVAMLLVSFTLDSLLYQHFGIALVPSLFLIGAALLFLLTSILLLAFSMVTLHRVGKAWPWSLGPHVAYNPQRLVTEGPYAIVRHPMVSAYLLYLVAIACAVPSVMMLIWMIPLTAGLFFEFLEYTEELRLQRWFGQEYRRYHLRTPSLIPYLQPYILDWWR